MSGINFEKYTPPGPVGAGFIEALGPIDIIMGPAGSGKTVASAYKGPYIASKFFPVCRDGVIRVRQAALRDTYRDLARTCLASWHEIFPPASPYTVDYAGGQDRPVNHKLRWETIRDNSLVKVEFDMQFGAIGNHNLEQFIKGYEISIGWCNEVDLMDERAPQLLLQRTGRYPAVADIAPSELDRIGRLVRQVAAKQNLPVTLDDDETLLLRMVYGDMNPPDIGHWTYQKMVRDKLPGWTLHQQPSGLSPHAENRVGKPRSSYEYEALTQEPYLVQRYVHGKFGYARDGDPVYPQFDINLHVSDQPLQPIEGLPIALGIDAGGSPAVSFSQYPANGQMRILREICMPPGSGPSSLTEAIFEMLISDFRGHAVSEAYADPSAWLGADRMAGELAYMETVARALNINILPAPSNELGHRREALGWYLGGVIDQNTPRLLVSSCCERTIGGFAAHFKYDKRTSEGATDKARVVKNEYSHIMEAHEYSALGHRGIETVISAAAKLGRAANVVPLGSRQAKTNFNIWRV
ncbi:MAG: hypothetical protein KDJ77_20100 [Rhodobiaceae bacterium]|nr:hypothetical protein [Rhodobiaceae bacterium]